MNYEIVQWAQRHGVAPSALAELQQLFVGHNQPGITVSSGKSESAVQNEIRLAAAKKGWGLWRNNVGVLRDDRGIPVRYGLANDTPALNKSVKSGDLIGIKPTVITSDMVGTTLGQFVSIEVKHEDWVYKGTVHERAQLKWQQIVVGLGGHAMFANSPKQV